MENENIETVEKNEELVYDPVTEIQKLKSNTVSKEEYNKVLEENKRYMKALIEGEQIEFSGAETEKVDISELREKLFSPASELSNLDYVQTALKLREAIIDTEGRDIFVGSGSKLTPDTNDYETAQKVADSLQSCIDVAEGNSEIFTRELMRITSDSPLGSAKINPKIKR